MVLAGIIVFVVLVSLSLGQLFFTQSYLRQFHNYRLPDIDAEDLPHAAVILCLRGTDPLLSECLDRLASQDYPSFDIRIVIDSPSDPSRVEVERWLETEPGVDVRISYLDKSFPFCHLKSAAIHQAISALEDSIDYVALVDADTMTPPDWLRLMMIPLLEDEIGVVTGSRWYRPCEGRFGSLVRYLYNSAAVVMMYFLQLTWAGSLTMKRAVFGQFQFLEQLRNVACEDHAIYLALRSAKLKLHSSADATLFNREECNLGECFSFIHRQIVWVRLFSRHWNFVMWQAIAVASVVIATCWVASVAMALADWPAAAWAAAGLASIYLVNVATVFFHHRAVMARWALRQLDSIRPIPFRVLFKLPLALPLTLLIYAWAVIAARFAKRVHWRGMTYDVIPPSHIQLVEYVPCESLEPQCDTDWPPVITVPGRQIRQEKETTKSFVGSQPYR